MEIGSQEFLNIITGLTLMILIISLIIQSNQIKKQIRIQNDQIRVSLFSDYTKRYQEIMRLLPVKIWDEDFKIESCALEEQELILKALQSYIDLCSEEYYLHKTQKISEDVWIEWQKGIISIINRPAVKKVWYNIQKFNFYDDFKDYLNSNIE